MTSGDRCSLASWVDTVFKTMDDTVVPPSTAALIPLGDATTEARQWPVRKEDLGEKVPPCEDTERRHI